MKLRQQLSSGILITQGETHHSLIIWKTIYQNLLISGGYYYSSEITLSICLFPVLLPAHGSLD